MLFNAFEAVRATQGYSTLFQGIDLKNFLLISAIAINGILIGAVQKHLDSIIKGYIYVFSSILVIILSVFFLDYSINIPFFIGAILVIFSVYTYNRERDLELSNNARKPEEIPQIHTDKKEGEVNSNV